jgi:predicted nucleic acid-binding Zn ribbon protein
MQSINATTHGALAKLLRNTPLTPGKTEFAWRAAVGPAMARATHVRLDGDGVLRVETRDPRWAIEVRRSSSLIVARLNSLLGDGVVKQIKAHHA